LDESEKIIDLKEETYFIEQYVNLRNSYCNLLLTKPVTVAETREWLNKKDIEIRCIVCRNELLGAAILYIRKNGEIAFFARDRNKGIGSRLLNILEEVAREKGIKTMWAWVLCDNMIAQRVFDKNGFLMGQIIEKEYNDLLKPGIKYTKCLDIC
jgi:GNAT superfamily N-acetyltransferase